MRLVIKFLLVMRQIEYGLYFHEGLSSKKRKLNIPIYMTHSTYKPQRIHVGHKQMRCRVVHLCDE